MLISSHMKGVHPQENKLTEDAAIWQAGFPEKLFIHLSQHIGAPLSPLVKPGDQVERFQKLADSKEFVSAPVHSPAKGKVISIEPYPHPNGSKQTAIIIQTEEEKVFEPVKKKAPNDPKEIIAQVREAGIVGLGGAMFPTHVKLSVPKDKKIDTLIINGAECEPFLTADSALMREKPHEIILGITILMKALKLDKVIIGIEKNKLIASDTLKKALKKSKTMKVRDLPSIYPQGAEKVLIKNLTGRSVPSGKLPLDVGVIVINVATAFAVYEAIYLGKPLVERVVTVSGDVKHPSNLMVRLGTPYSSLIDECGGCKGRPRKILCGGPMMGLSQPTDEASLIKGNNGVLALNSKEFLQDFAEEPCIRCGRCVDSCPASLYPTLIAARAKAEKPAIDLKPLDCFECGSCSFICPSRINLLGWIKIAKRSAR